MYTPDDRDIDKLSREAAEQYQAPGKPDWNKLQQALDKELPVEKEKKRRGLLFFFLLGAGLLLGGGLWFSGTLSKSPAPANAKAQTPNKASGDAVTGKTPDQSPDQSAPATTVTNTAQPATTGSSKPADAPTDGGSKEDRAGDLSAGKEEPATRLTHRAHAVPGETTTIAGANLSAEANERRVRKEKINTLSGTLSPGTPGVTEQSTEKTGSKLTAKHNRKEKSGKRDKPAIPSPAAADDTGANADQSGSTGITNAPADLAKNPDEPASANDNTSKSPAVAAPAMAQPADSNTSVKSKPAPKNKKQGNHFIAFGITAGTDLSTVKFTHNDKPGYSAGLTLGYGFNTKWAVYTGLTYTKKNYTLNGKDYHPPQHYWTQYVSLQTVSGDCRMLEIPLSVAYTINPSAKNAVFVSAGVSSYLMKKQNYEYYYKNNVGQRMSSTWSNDSTFKHYFSVLDLSAGITRHLSKHLVANIEPYARIPLGGVGFGNIRLSSFGLNFSVQYRQPLKR